MPKTLSTQEFLKQFQAQSAPAAAPTASGKVLSADEFAKKFTAQNTPAPVEQKQNIPWRVDPLESDSALMTGVKSAVNVVPSAFSFAKDQLKMLAETPGHIASIPSEIKGLVKDAGGVKKALTAFGRELPGETYRQAIEPLTPPIKAAAGAVELLGGPKILSDETLARTREQMTVDPFKSVAPLALIGRQAAQRAGVGPQVDAAISKVAAPVIKTAESIAGRTGETVGATTRFGVGQVTGLKPETVSRIAETPEAFSKEAMAGVSRETLGKEIETKLNERLAALEETGKGYNPVRELQAINREVANTNVKIVKEGGRSIVYDLIHAPIERLTLPELRRKAQLLVEDPSSPKALITKTNKEIAKRETAETIPHKINVSPKFFENVIKSTTGVEVQNGKIRPTGTSKIRDAGDVRALQYYLDFWRPIFGKGFLTVDEMLNFRSDLAKAAKFEKDIGVRSDVQKATGIMRAKFNEKYRGEVPGLEKLDLDFSTQKGEFNRLKEELFDKNNELKKSATDKIANTIGRGQRKADFLVKLEEISPGITKKIEILKAVEDIQDASGIKVGTYTRTLAPLATGYVLGVIPAVIQAVLSSPGNAVPIIRSYGLIKNSNAVKAVVQGLKSAAENVNALPAMGDKEIKMPGAFTKKVAEKSGSNFGKELVAR